jgi:predicted O-methyltransferase YrrM
MKPTMLPPFHQIFDYIKPEVICEIGTHDGKSAIQFVDYCVKLNPKLSYVGYDVFDAVKDDEQFHEKEINGKGAGKYRTAKNNLTHRQMKNKRFKFKLVKGFTQQTLTQAVYDFVYIDGGHSYETVKHDYYKVSGSKVIVFDDYQTEGVKQFVDELIRKNKLVEYSWDEVFDAPKPCISFMPHNSTKHIQPVVFNV